ncbi:dihydrodipicolinate synthase family protein (plasmid) [Nocardioides sp. R1-1]|uniref:dihydrodipicolinate synthase family protein n=1 Tax=Nocardioides sp. R1-1 TaxID=3383502 RepID=UPI0038CF6206
MTPTLELRGILPAVITPFTEDGLRIDVEALRTHVRRLVDAGCGGLIPGGTTGEFAALTIDERKLLHETVISAAGGEVPVLPQTGALTAVEAIELTQHAQRSGAAGVMVIPPFFDELTFAEIRSYYVAVADAVEVPVMLYNIPGATGQHLSPGQLAELASVPGVTSIKDSGADATALTALLLEHGDDVQVVNGWDTFTFLGLASGAQASVWGAANIFPELAVELFETIVDREDLKAGRALWRRLFPVVEFLEKQSYATRVKTACALQGKRVGPVRAPLLPLPAEDEALLVELLEAADLLPADALVR